MSDLLREAISDGLASAKKDYEFDDVVDAIHEKILGVSGDGPLFGWCPDCNGEGIIHTMSSGPDLSEYATNCERCTEFKGMVQMWPAAFSTELPDLPDDVGTYQLKASRSDADSPWEYEWVKKYG